MTTSDGRFEIDRQRHLQSYAARLQLEVERLTWPLEKLQRLRDQRLSYTSMLRRLGEAKRRGGLSISPTSVMCAFEPLTRESRMRLGVR